MSRVNEIPFPVLFGNGVVLIIISEREFKRFIRQSIATEDKEPRGTSIHRYKGESDTRREMSLNIFSEKFVDNENIKLPKPGVAS